MPPTLPNGITSFDAANIIKENVHQNFKHHFKPGHSYTVELTGTGLTGYNTATKNIQWLIQNAIDNNIRMRAMGSNWALSPAASSDSMINTKHLNLRFPLQQTSLADAYLQSGKTTADVLFLQCGNMIWNINKYIETQLGRCLRASGGSNGQTIAGATSTGTHGGALFTGSVHDAILGLHIVTGADKHVWIERASRPAVTDSFINKLGATAIRDDDMFNAAVVSFGSFGVIHGILLETEPLYVLKEYRFKSITYSDKIIEAISTLNFDLLRECIPEFPTESADNKLYHFEVSINLHKLEKDNPNKGIYVQAFFKQPSPAGYTPQHDYTQSTASYSKDTMGIVSQLVDAIGTTLQHAIIKPLVNQLFESGLRVEYPTAKTIGEIFCYTRFRGQIASAAIGLNTKDVFKALDTIVHINENNPLPGAIALRFVKGTDALLGFTKYENSCVLEIDGIDSDITREFFSLTCDKLEANGIPYTLHWGKFNYPLTKERVLNAYGESTVKKWLDCRAELLSPEVQRVFTNDLMVQCGLVNTAGPVPPPIV
jgi:hypothetical protein